MYIAICIRSTSVFRTKAPLQRVLIKVASFLLRCTIGVHKILGGGVLGSNSVGANTVVLIRSARGSFARILASSLEYGHRLFVSFLSFPFLHAGSSSRPARGDETLARKKKEDSSRSSSMRVSLVAATARVNRKNLHARQLEDGKGD